MPDISETQTCSNPDCPKPQPLPIEQFAIRGDSGKRRGQCRDCIAKRRSRHWHNNKEQIGARQKQRYEENKEVILAKNSAYWQRTKEVRHQKQREYHQSEQGKKTTAKWKKKNRKQIREKKNANARARRKNDPVFRLRTYFSNAIRDVLMGRKNYDATWEHLPYTPQELKDHIENLFEPWMTWENYGVYNPQTHATNPTWQIDHIIPHSTFKYKSMKSKAFRACWALSNLRPLNAKQNNADGVSRIRHGKKKGMK